MPRMRSIADTAKIFRELDPDTEITAYTIRRMIQAGQLSIVKTGTKVLINVDKFLETLEQTGVYSPTV